MTPSGSTKSKMSRFFSSGMFDVRTVKINHRARLAITLPLLLALTACAQHPLAQPPKRTEAVILFKLVDELPSYAAPNSVAVTRCLSDGLCEMHILESYYPECLVHEFGHVTHKDWHGNTPTTCRYGSKFK